jgi:hypothetical protein
MPRICVLRPVLIPDNDAGYFAEALAIDTNAESARHGLTVARFAEGRR